MGKRIAGVKRLGFTGRRCWRSSSDIMIVYARIVWVSMRGIRVLGILAKRKM